MGELGLPPELISLVHQIELNKVGWWEKGIQKLILATVWLSGENPKLEVITQNIQEKFGITIEATKVKAQIESLCSSGDLVPLAEGRYKITERTLKASEKDLEDTEQIITTVKSEFVRIVNHHCPSLNAEEVWDNFNKQFLLPLVRQLGASTYHLGSFWPFQNVPWERALSPEHGRFRRYVGHLTSLAFIAPCTFWVQAIRYP